ncbi:MAG: T9SS type A sorting domain-containing protein [Candidatus Kapaibacterium sp.]
MRPLLLRSILTLSLLLPLFWTVSAVAQNRSYDQWCFGLEVGLDFRSGSPPQLFQAPIQSIEGTASICDPRTGALFFFTDGVTVWNQNHQIMSNGTNLNGHQSSTQSALIVPHPGDSGIYYLFTADAGPYGLRLLGINYSVVDMKRAGGLGEVVQKNIPLLKDATEKLVGIYHCGDTSTWVLAHELGSDRYFAWEVTSGGLNTTPVITAIGNVHSSANDRSSAGYLKASPSGHYLISIDAQIKRGELFQFNPGTGVVEKKLGEIDADYGASFSPNSSYVYVTEGDSLQSQFTIYQYTMLPANSEEIALTKRPVSTVKSTFADPILIGGALQIAPDRLIYLTSSTGEIGRIINPDQPGASFEKNVILFPDITKQKGFYGLPNCIDGLFSSIVDAGRLRAIFTPGDTTICAGESLTFIDQSRGRPMVFDWSVTGDTSFTVSGRNLGNVTFNKPGRYEVTLQVTRSCTTDASTATIIVHPVPVADAGPDRGICLGGSTQLAGSGGGTYRWTPSRGLDCDTCATPTASPTTTTTYKLIVENESGCKDTSNVTVRVSATLDVQARDTTICAGETVALKATGAVDYEWSNTSGEVICSGCPEITVTPTQTTTYYVRGKSAEDCEGYDTVTVTLNPLPVAKAGKDTAICSGGTVMLGEAGSVNGLRYAWEPATGLNNPNSPRPIASPTETTTYTLLVTDIRTGCVALDSVIISVNALPIADAGRDSTFCISGRTILGGRDAEPGFIYQWSPATGLDNPNSPRPTASITETTTYQLTVTNSEGECSSIDSVTISINAPPVAEAGRDTALCLGGATRLGGRDAEPGLIYQWSPVKGLDDPNSPHPIASPTESGSFQLLVTDTRTGCTAVDSVSVTLHNLPIADAGRDTAFCFGETTRLGGRDAEPNLNYQWQPTTGLDNPNSPHPIASPTVTTTYVLHVTNRVTGCEAYDTVQVRTGNKLGINAWIDRDYQAIIGQRLTIAVKVDPVPPGSNISDLLFTLEYDAGVLYPDVNSIAQLLNGTLLEGWSVTIEEVSPGLIEVRLTAPPGKELTGEGNLILLEGNLYLGAKSATELPFTLLTTNACVDITTKPGYAKLDTICGLNFRLIELNASKYAIPQARPNPSGNHVQVEFSVGLDGPVQLEVFDAVGNKVGVLVDRELEAGSYTVEWDATSAGAGAYWLRLQSGETVKLGRVVVE